MNRREIAEIIYLNLNNKLSELKKKYQATKNKIGYFYIDELLPDELAQKISSCFPKTKYLHLKKSLREYKYIGYEMNKYHPIINEVIYSFHEKKVLDVFSKIIQLDSLYADDTLYAGGISIMKKNNFLNPHIDNSHDFNKKKWRAINLLYYMTPNWELNDGGNLEIWPNGIKNNPIIIQSKFNRLAVIATHDKSLHSVSPIKSNKYRKCISNYYFSDNPHYDTQKFQVTSFRGRPNQKIRDFILIIDKKIRMGIRKIFKYGIIKTKHRYKN